jgi:serine/threonine protein kinase
MLGYPPDSSHPSWTKAHSGNDTEAYSLEERIREIGMYDHEVYISSDDNPSSQRALLEPLGNHISEDEVRKLANLLRGALDYFPDKRSPAREIANHPWLIGGKEPKSSDRYFHRGPRIQSSSQHRPLVGRPHDVRTPDVGTSPVAERKVRRYRGTE